MTPEKWVPKVGEKVLIRATITEECHGEVVSVLGLSNPCPSDVECTVHFRPRRGEILPDPVPWMKRLVGNIWFTHNFGTDYLQKSSPPPCCSEHRLFYELNKAWPEVFEEKKR